MPSDIGADDGCSRPPMRSAFGHDGEHHRVVVAVVRALDLHDVVAARSRRARRGSRSSSPRCPSSRSAPARRLKRRHSSSANSTRVLGRRREVRAGASGPRDRLDDLRVRVADDHRAEAAVRVDVLVAVDVPDAARRGPRAGRSGTGRRPGTTSRHRAAWLLQRALVQRCATPACESRSRRVLDARRSRVRACSMMASLVDPVVSA